MTRGGIGPPRTARSPAQAVRSTATAATTINTSPNRRQPEWGPTAASCPVIGVSPHAPALTSTIGQPDDPRSVACSTHGPGLPTAVSHPKHAPIRLCLRCPDPARRLLSAWPSPWSSSADYGTCRTRARPGRHGLRRTPTALSQRSEPGHNSRARGGKRSRLEVALEPDPRVGSPTGQVRRGEQTMTAVAHFTLARPYHWVKSFPFRD